MLAIDTAVGKSLYAMLLSGEAQGTFLHLSGDGRSSSSSQQNQTGRPDAYMDAGQADDPTLTSTLIDRQVKTSFLTGLLCPEQCACHKELRFNSAWRKDFTGAPQRTRRLCPKSHEES